MQYCIAIPQNCLEQRAAEELINQVFPTVTVQNTMKCNFDSTMCLSRIFDKPNKTTDLQHPFNCNIGFWSFDWMTFLIYFLILALPPMEIEQQKYWRLKTYLGVPENTKGQSPH